jgi:hypothetical protein
MKYSFLSYGSEPTDEQFELLMHEVVLGAKEKAEIAMASFWDLTTDQVLRTQSESIIGNGKNSAKSSLDNNR